MDETSSFLRNVFQYCKAGGVPVWCDADDGFRSRRWLLDTALPASVVGYYCISTVKDIPRARVLQRRTEDLVETAIVVLDDIGTKVPRENIKVAPTYILETSAGNFQYGYLFKTPVEPARAAALIEALAAAGLTDPGAKRADRVVRYPGSMNVKYSPPFAARLVEAHWERTFTLSELALAFGVTPTDTQAAGSLVQPLADGETDPVFEWLLAHEMVIKGPNPRGWYTVHCPWEDEHTGEIDHGTDYMPGRPGAFKCLHSHGEAKTTAELKRWIGRQDPAAELGPFGTARLAALGGRLATALGLQPADLPGGGQPADAGDAGPVAERDRTRLWQALQAQAAAGTMFAPTPAATAAPTTVSGLLAGRLSETYLDPSQLPDCDMTSGGNVAVAQTTTEPRVHRVMQLIGMTARLNILTGRIECAFEGVPEYVAQLDENEAAVGALVHACARCGMKNSEAVRAALSNWAYEYRYSPVQEWILSTPWDGTSRLPALLRSLTLKDTSLEKWKAIALRRWLIQTVEAIRNWERGANATDVGHVLVLQGRQGVGKSRWFASLMPAQWVTTGMSLRLDTNERDAVKRATMTPITELGEIDGSFRRSDTAALKNFLTTRMDLYRPPYGRVEVARPRCTSFGASVNPEGFLIDQTGDRRFWPLAVERCDYGHGIDLQQLWAEVWTWAVRGEPFWLQPGEAELHDEMARMHRVDTDVGFVVDDLRGRREAFLDHRLWSIVATKELATHYGLKHMTAVYADLNAALELARFERSRTKLKRGWYLPPLSPALSPAQQAGLKLVTGGKADDGEN